MSVLRGIEVSAEGARVQAARVDVIANNLANATTPGFRRDGVGFRAHLEAAWPAVDRISPDPRPGDIEPTGRALDVAIPGAGFFAVRDLGTGAEFYTRAGNFELDGSGRLVTAGGRCQVLAADGTPVGLNPESAAAVRIDSDGTIRQGDAEYGQLGVVEFEDVARLAKRGDNLFENRGSALGGSPDRRIVPGALERSTVNPVLESAELSKALRALEANLELVRLQDASLERTVNDLARPAK